MKRIGLAVLLAAASAIALAACLKTLPDLKVSRDSGNYAEPFSLVITVTKPDDCTALTVELSVDGRVVRRSTLLSDGANQLPPVSINGPTTLEVALKPSSACWFYQARTFAYEFNTPKVLPDMSTPPDMVPPPDLTAPPDLLPPPDLIDPCLNFVKDGTETDIDCGGSTCVARCTAGQMCNMTSDCDNALLGLVCSGMRCANP